MHVPEKCMLFERNVVWKIRLRNKIKIENYH
jgi:hypothetical protein